MLIQELMLRNIHAHMIIQEYFDTLEWCTLAGVLRVHVHLGIAGPKIWVNKSMKMVR